MKIAVIGPGAIGGLVAGYLKEQGEDVSLVGTKDTVEAINKKGLSISGVRGNVKVNIQAAVSLDKKVDLIILTTKTQDIEKALRENKQYLAGAIILTAQNGVEADEIVAQFVPRENIISSIVMFGATYLKPGEIVHNFERKWVIGKPFGKNDDWVKRVSILLGRIFPIEISDDIKGMKWLKVFANANNCIAGITGKSMQECFANLDLCEISLGIWQEGLGVIKKAGIKLVNLPDFTVEQVTKLTSLPIKEAAKIFSGIMINLSKEPLYGSILQSIKRGKASEIDYLNGAFVKLARQCGYHTPLNKKLTELVHKVEEEHKFFTIDDLIEKTKNLIPQQSCDDSGKVNTPFPKLKLTVVKVEGDCYHGYKQGDEIVLEDFTHPPKHFCLGLAHALFPVIYALSFGAKFGFRDNQRSLLVTCPDGGKLEFKAEIFDKEGKIEVIEKDPNHKGPNPKEMVLEVVQSKGKCAYGYKLGDRIEVKGLKCPEGFCGAAYHCAFPALFALNFGAKFFFMDDPDGINTVTCPDGGNIVFKVSRKKVSL
ncbi:MAG: 2-dehydropantoate 2-reductase [Candidatus Omnitrophica bacterium]|jgi:2-dehydropantoate 2-reductase|nr:2-dehydropantoate 2-reductase [Candidatus Omnitrophota bacterium]